ncbi:MAG: hypothetical protein H5T76_05725 [Streptomyces sp.]|nr:hypothetical protein [Streptomyces sp.]
MAGLPRGRLRERRPTLSDTRYLTPEQWAEADRIRMEWQAHEQATGPADRTTSEAAISQLYRTAGRSAPRFAWVASPKEADALIRTATGSEPGRSPVGPVGAWLPTAGKRQLRVPVTHREEQSVAGWLSGLSEPMLRSLSRTSPTDPLGLHTAPIRATYRPALYEVPRRLGIKCYSSRSTRRLDAWLETVRSCGSWWPFEDVCVVSERPTEVHLEPGPEDSTSRLHHSDGPALLYPDGTAVHAWHGVRVPPYVITGELTGQDWLNEANSEVRRAIADRMGYDWLLEHCGARRFATDDYGSLWRIPDPRDPSTLRQDYGPPVGDGRWYYPDGSEPEEDIVLVLVENSTPEPDGSYRRYALRVPPDQTVPRDAIGWTFGLPPDTYAPDAMT